MKVKNLAFPFFNFFHARSSSFTVVNKFTLKLSYIIVINRTREKNADFYKVWNVTKTQFFYQLNVIQ